MAKPSLVFFVVSLLLLLLSFFLQAPAAVAAVTCNPTSLSPCAGAIMGSAAPTPACCTKLREQKPCFCQYMKNPSLRGYIKSANGKRVAGACGVPYPNC